MFKANKFFVLSKHLFCIAFVCLLGISCASKKSSKCRVKSPKTQTECIDRVTRNFGKIAKADPGVDLNHDGKITGVDWSLCREIGE